MKNLQMPSSYALIPQEEQREVTGGGEFGDALNSFFENLHLRDFFLGGGLISFSFTFVPMLLFNAVKTGVVFGFKVYNTLSKWLGFRDDTVESAQRYALQRRAEEKEVVTPDENCVLHSFF